MEKFKQAYEICIKKAEKHFSLYNGEPYDFSGLCMSGDYYNETQKQSIYHMYSWTASFVTGLAPLLYRTEKNDEYLKWANQFENDYYSKINHHSMDTMHDLGFLYSPYCVAMYKLTGRVTHKQIAIKAADELAKRFDIKGQYIDAWRRMDDTQRMGKAIIDCMMNLPLLFWAWEETGHTFYRDVAYAHAETTKKYFIRDDFSVAHAFDFNRATGQVEGENNGCGYANGSHWARGTAWAVYGFSVAARYLKSCEYYNLAKNIAYKYISCLPKEEAIPIWDFCIPKDKPAKACGDTAFWQEEKIENCIYNVDTSAAAIMTSAIIELNKYDKDERLQEFADLTLKFLILPDNLDSDMKVPGLLKRQNGQMAYTIFGDYFLCEALQKRLFDTESCW